MKTIYYHLILDRSGSMSSVKEETILAFNKQLAAIRELKKDYPDQPVRISLTVFNHEVSHLLDRTEPEAAQMLDHKSYVPGGYTALYDAVGMSIVKTKADIKNELESGDAEVIMVIITDGHENASREYSHNVISALIEALEKTGDWKFSYLGATLDAVEIADGLSISQDSSLKFSIDNIGGAMDKISDSMKFYFKEKRINKNAKWKLDNLK